MNKVLGDRTRRGGSAELTAHPPSHGPKATVILCGPEGVGKRRLRTGLLYYLAKGLGAENLEEYSSAFEIKTQEGRFLH
jgi:hypothetical protein